MGWVVHFFGLNNVCEKFYKPVNFKCVTLMHKIKTLCKCNYTYEFSDDFVFYHLITKKVTTSEYSLSYTLWCPL